VALLAVEDLAIDFGGLTALGGVGFEVDAGGIVALIGPNGAGKTTVFNVLSGLYRPDRGRIVFAGVDAGDLPLGSQKRLEMARALAGGPRLLLLDEPAGGLNPTETRTLMDLIRRLRDELGLAIMVVEHDMDLVMAISDRVAVLHHGLVIATGSPREVAANPAVIDAYLGPPASAPL
jgi:ABC-type branched-subunit amino acid transport system ATPase component